ncbi:unnamed protein product [Euphydryas editha]|uniref:Cytochrome P450 302A1 n=1 Tax=Euphydryas editha TaxID=104508 RepID=A0AAU9VB73_EUPED|nr:unnamed protein product [Euphydryas editha]
MLKTFIKEHFLKIVCLPKYSLNTRAVDKNMEHNSSVRNFEDIPGPKNYPLIGTLYKYLPFLGDYDVDAMDKAAWLNWRKYGGLVREFPGVRLLHVFEPDLIEAVFRQKERYPARRSHIAMLHYRLNKPEVYNTGGLLSTNGPEWWRIRSTFQKNFSSPHNAKHYINDVDNITRKFVEWIKECKISSKEDFLPYLNRLYLEVIGVIAFNEHFESFTSQEQDPESRSSKVIKAAFESNKGIMKLDKGTLWKYLKTPLYRTLARSQEYLEKVSLDILLKRLNFYENEKENNDKSLLASFILLPNVDIKDITGVMVDILMAAIDTTSYTTSFALYHLARNEGCQKKVFEELLLLMPEKDTEVTSDIISKAVYLRSCVKESLRLNPVSIGVGRLLQQDIVLKGYLIPKDTVIVTQNMVACRLPQYIKDPLLFKPERWIRDSDQYEVIHPFLSLPFGFGPRSCIARRLAEQNICITLIRLFRDFDIKWKGSDLGFKTLLINKPDQPISLCFTPRNL